MLSSPGGQTKSSSRRSLNLTDQDGVTMLWGQSKLWKAMASSFLTILTTKAPLTTWSNSTWLVRWQLLPFLKVHEGSWRAFPNLIHRNKCPYLRSSRGQSCLQPCKCQSLETRTLQVQHPREVRNVALWTQRSLSTIGRASTPIAKKFFLAMCLFQTKHLFQLACALNATLNLHVVPSRVRRCWETTDTQTSITSLP